jgi:hypothetical protein
MFELGLHIDDSIEIARAKRPSGDGACAFEAGTPVEDGAEDIERNEDW